MRLNKYLAQSGIASRRGSDHLIKAATITINNIVVTDPAYDIKENDIVKYDGKNIQINNKTIVLMFNKPMGIITTMNDPQNRLSVADLLPKENRVFPIGRLDKNTTGLLLVTNNGDLANRLMHPRNRVPKIYEAIIDRPLEQKNISKIKNGIFIGAGEWGKANIISQKKSKKRTLVILELRHGKNREIRRLFHAIDHKLFSLKRVQYAGLDLGHLPLGQYRSLDHNELRKIQSFTK